MHVRLYGSLFIPHGTNNAVQIYGKITRKNKKQHQSTLYVFKNFFKKIKLRKSIKNRINIETFVRK